MCGMFQSGESQKGMQAAVATAPAADEYMTVSQLNMMIATQMLNTPQFHNVWVKGEVTNYNGHTKHYYFSIKDDICKIDCKLWESKAATALKFKLEKGQEIAVRGDIEFYDRYGTCSITVSKIINLGEGDAMLKYQQLKEKLQLEGIFDPEHKKIIPTHANRIGVVTSRSGKAIGDIMKIAQERNPYVQVVLYSVNVQGVNAVASTVEGIRRLDREKLDVIIVGRGGGSDEDLLVYDDERMVRAVYEAKTPIVSAVGHQDHNPLVDLAVDMRFATPTDAAQHVIFDVISEQKRVRDIFSQIRAKAANYIRVKKLTLKTLRANLEINGPRGTIEAQKARLNNAKLLMSGQMSEILQSRKLHLTGIREGLAANSPQAKIQVKKIRLNKALEGLAANSPQVRIQERRIHLNRAREGLAANSPRLKIQERKNHLEVVRQKLRTLMDSVYESKKGQLEVKIATLNGLSPSAKLVKGFGYISVNEKPVMSVSELSPGDDFSVRIHDGSINARVLNTYTENISV